MKMTANGFDIQVTDQGSGMPALVFLHYWGGSSRTWDDVVAALPSRYRTVRPDLRGWGDSTPTQGSQAPQGYALNDFVADAVALVDELGLNDYVLIGHSMGGKIAQLFASKRPKGLTGLILIAPAPPGPLNLPPQAMVAMASAYDSAQSVEQALEHMLTAKALSPAHHRQVIADSLRGAPDAKKAWPASTSREDITQLVRAIDVPTLVIAGEADRVDSVATLTSELLPHIPQAVLHTLPGTGHLSPLEAPIAIATLIADFVEGTVLRDRA
jgi:pimeloyl-ACP methyl ester carboxylesterase